MMDHRAVSDNGLILTTSGVKIDVRLPWYRTLPLSVVEFLGVEIDGKAFDLEKLDFELEGKFMPLTSLRPKTNVWWYVLDSGFIHIDSPDFEKGKSYSVSVTVSFKPPYIQGLNRIIKTTKSLVAH